MLPGRVLFRSVIVVAVVLVAPPAGAVWGDGSSVEVGAAGGYARRSPGRREVTFLLSLALPLDRLARPRALDAPTALAEPPRESRRGSSGDAEADATLRPDATDAPAWEAPRAELTSRLARATVKAALQVAGSPRTAARLDGLSARSRSSALLPEMRLRAERSTDEALRLAPTSADPYRYTRSGGVTLTLEARATWRLDRLVFADEEVAVEKLRRARARAEQRLVHEVLGSLAAWQRALWVLSRPELSDERKLAAEVERLEAEVRLDVLTAGRFSVLARLTGKSGWPARHP